MEVNAPLRLDLHFGNSLRMMRPSVRILPLGIRNNESPGTQKSRVRFRVTYGGPGELKLASGDE